MSGFVSFVSSGPGDPELLTVKAVKRLQEAEVVLFDDLSAGPILEHVSPEADLIGVGKRAGRLSPKQDHVSRLLVEHALTGARVVRLKSGEEVEVHNPADLPDPTRIEEILEPYVKLTIFTPEEYVGSLMQLLQEKRGRLVNMNYLPGAQKRVELVYEAPFAEILYDFHDRLKSVSRGYASMDYEQAGYRPGDLVKVNVLVHGEVVDALTFIAHREKAYTMARAIVDKLAEVIPRQLFEVPIQAAIGGKIIARATVKALRKDVLAKCYGGDVTRKKKLLEKQKKGKAKMKQFGSVNIPQKAFISVLRTDKD